MQSKILTVLSLVAAASAHGKVTSPTPRPAGDAFKAACGTTMWNTEQADPFGNIQGLAQQVNGDVPADCELYLCKGYKFADNAANVQSYQPGEKVDFKVEIRAPHTGVANVSVVDTASNSIIGSPLISFTNYASTKTGVAANNTAFSVTLPDSLPATCGTAGNCVLQWWWYSDEAKQTYMSCVDFSFGSGSGSAPAPAPASSAPATPASSAAPTTLATVATPSATPSAPAAGASDEASDPVASAPASSCNKRRSSKRALRKSF